MLFMFATEFCDAFTVVPEFLYASYCSYQSSPNASYYSYQSSPNASYCSYQSSLIPFTVHMSFLMFLFVLVF